MHDRLAAAGPVAGATAGAWCAEARERWLLEPGAAPGASARAALFLDRDGVLVEEVGILRRPRDVRLLAGAAAAVRRANLAGVPVVVVTNQSGIGRGHCDWGDYEAVTRAILAELDAAGARLAAVYACPYHPQGRGRYAHPDHPQRKPNPGLLLRAALDLGLDLGASWIVGDSARDLQAGRAAGLAGGVHVWTGHGPAQRSQVPRPTSTFAVRYAADLATAVEALPLFDATGRPTGGGLRAC